MTISFFSNFLNSHQLPFCSAIIKRIGEVNFRFVATQKIAPDRVAMGFVDMNEIHPFVVKEYEGEKGKEEARRLALESDVMIIGSAPFEYANLRLKNNKLTFIYAERLFKKGKLSLLYPPKAIKVYNLYTKNRKKNCFLLCASAYSKGDAGFCGFPSERCFKWGYFPELETYKDFEQSVLNKKVTKRGKEVSILWTGRLIDWKHPEMAILVAKQLVKSGHNFKLIIIGDGPMRSVIQNEILKNNLTDHVSYLGAIPPQQVRCIMEQSDIFLFTSDKNEGWGAVLNESMNCGCAVVANKSIGSVPFLIKDKVNGLICRNESVSEVVEKVIFLIEHVEKRLELSVAAHYTICNEWNADVATDNFFLLINAINKGIESPIVNGPCSKA